jgi:hypothetical protein
MGDVKMGDAAVGGDSLTADEKAAVDAETSAHKKVKDPTCMRLLQMTCGQPGSHILEQSTRASLAKAWSLLDANGDGQLSREDYTSIFGVDEVWKQLVHLCDINADGSISTDEFEAGFTLFAISKEISLEIKGHTNLLALLNIVQKGANQLVLEKLDELTVYMQTRKAEGW